MLADGRQILFLNKYEIQKLNILYLWFKKI